MGVFQSNVFQNSVFQGPHAGATATASVGVGLAGHWRGPARSGYVGRIRRLSELDATATATAGEVLTEQTFNVDPETARKIEQQVMTVVGVADNAAAERRKELLARKRALTDDDETFMLM